MTRRWALVVAATAVAAASLTCGCVVPGMRRHRIPYQSSVAVTGMVVILSAQATFHRTDFYKKGEFVYANPKDGTGLYDLYQLPDGTKVELLDSSLALASKDGPTPKTGYVFTFLTRCADTGAYDYRIQFAVCATPTAYTEMRRSIYVADSSGTVYEADAAAVYPGLRTRDWVLPLTEYPSAAELAASWRAVWTRPGSPPGPPGVSGAP